MGAGSEAGVGRATGRLPYLAQARGVAVALASAPDKVVRFVTRAAPPAARAAPPPPVAQSDDIVVTASARAAGQR